MKKIFFDTNALTGLYAYSSDTLQQVVSTLERVKNKLNCTFIVPATVREEYERHYQKSRSRTGDKYPLSIFRREFNKQKSLLLDRMKKIQPIKLSTIFDTKIDNEIEQFFSDTRTHLNCIEQELVLLESKNNTDSIDDTNDVLYQFVISHSITKLSLQEKIKMASLAEIRFAQKIKPGLTDENKKEEYKFQKYGDVFIWYEILNNCSDEDDIVFIENEKKEDWWESKDSGIIASELKEEFKEKFPHADIEMLSFDDFYAKYMDDIMEDGEAKIEINAVRNKVNDYLADAEFISDLENRLMEFISDEEIESWLLEECFDGGLVSEVNDIDVLKISINRETAHPVYDSFDCTINDKCTANVFVDCTVLSEFDRDSIPATIELKLCFVVEIIYVYDLIINSKKLSSILNCEEHTLKEYNVKAEKNISYGYDEEETIGTYGNCTNCSAPINDDNYGDGTLCRSCMLSVPDDDF